MDRAVPTPPVPAAVRPLTRNFRFGGQTRQRIGLHDGEVHERRNRCRVIGRRFSFERENRLRSLFLDAPRRIREQRFDDCDECRA